MCGLAFYLNMVLLLLGLCGFSVYLYISRDINVLVYIRDFLMKMLDPGLPE